MSHRLITDYAPNAAIECSCLGCGCLLHGASWLERHPRLNLGCSALALGCESATRPTFAKVCQMSLGWHNCIVDTVKAWHGTDE